MIEIKSVERVCHEPAAPSVVARTSAQSQRAPRGAIQRNRRQHRRVVQVLLGLGVAFPLVRLRAPILIVECELVGLWLCERQVLAKGLHSGLLGGAGCSSHHVTLSSRKHVVFHGFDRLGRRGLVTELDLIELGAHNVCGFLAADVGKDLSNVRVCLSVEKLLNVNFSHKGSLLLDLGYEALADLFYFRLDLEKGLRSLVLLEVQHLANCKNALFQGHEVLGASRLVLVSGLLEQIRCNFARLLNQLGKLLNFQLLCRLNSYEKLEGSLDILTPSKLLKNAIKSTLSFLDFVDLGLQAMDTVSQVDLFLVELL